ncbi:LAMI_0E06348g1_1 [Lachancea mirantina]|uniref:LAMI_0E06348g1_1 n=1 Tax=Lachancea mirantina TaxID=1230905 RepID=A0A1G4JLS8_9SACH|nr:LAMI_0E06348g1_1 [Lachancea mirantina]
MKTILISDFDETITTKDTISILGELPYRSKQCEVPWSHFVETYLQGYRRYETTPRKLPLLGPDVLAGEQPITTANYDQAFQAEIQYQNSLRPIELNSLAELERTEAFTDVTETDVLDLAADQKQLIQEGFPTALPLCDEFHVLSVNWCTDFILAVIKSSTLDPETLQKINPAQVYCNSLIRRGPHYTGLFEKTIVTGYDKLDKLNKLVNSFPPNLTCWYVGDSESDLLSILHPKINGVLLLDPHTNEKKFRRIASDIMGLNQAVVTGIIQDATFEYRKFTCKQNGNLLVFAKNWHAIARLLHQD